MLPDQHTDFSRGRSGGLVFPSLSEFSTVYCDPHSQGFGIVNKTEIDVFLELSCFLMIQQMLAIWSLVPLPFLKPAWTSECSQFTYCWSLAWRILSITLLACDMSLTYEINDHTHLEKNTNTHTPPSLSIQYMQVSYPSILGLTSKIHFSTTSLQDTPGQVKLGDLFLPIISYFHAT